ncbi:hypothetical protein [Robertkochia aurantiaca]|uniref:hypothetical protein n=1 Tax=Robertkochia aurantiaca TaxID=2873700 RepID=UPI001CCC0B58|nr:hypothetical protein [Robertkochia sp. 3YJGBD-33]
MNTKINSFKNFIEVICDKIKGVKYGKKTIVDLELNNETTFNRLKTIVSELDNRCVLKFYDAYFGLQPNQLPVTLGDSGAFTEVRKDKTEFKARLGNHGGYKFNGRWIILSEQELIERIYKSRMFNSEKMTLESRLIRKQWRKVENGKALYEFHHDITDKQNLDSHRL